MTINESAKKLATLSPHDARSLESWKSVELIRMRFRLGIRDFYRIISSWDFRPGCPVCVTPARIMTSRHAGAG